MFAHEESWWGGLCVSAAQSQPALAFLGVTRTRNDLRGFGRGTIKATAHQLARLIYAMLTRGEEYVERDLATMETERRDRQLKNLQRQARHFNLALVPIEHAA